MFSSSQEMYIKNIVPVMREEGYKYYVAYTYTRTNSDWNGSVQPDLYIVFSKTEISAQSAYSYIVPQNSVLYSVRTPNYSTNNSAVNTDRVVTQTYGGNLRIDVYEHVYTNAEFSGTVFQPDILYSEGIYLNEAVMVSNILVAVFLLFVVFRSIIRVKGR